MFPLLEKTDEQTRGSLDPVQTVADLPNTKLPLILSLLSHQLVQQWTATSTTTHFTLKREMQNIIILYVNTFTFLKNNFSTSYTCHAK